MTLRLSDTNPVNQALLQVAAGQERLIDLIESRSDATSDSGLDAESRMRLRSIDVQLLKISEELAAGRQDVISELRADLSSLTRAVAAGLPKDGT